MLALVWTLPVQKLLLIAGLTWGHRRMLSPGDYLALLPETALAAFLTIGLLTRRKVGVWRFGVNLTAATLVLASWVVVASWIVAGTPLSYQFLQRLVWEPVIFRTILASSTFLLQILSAIGVLLLLWMGMLVISRWAKKATPILIQRRSQIAQVLLATGLLCSLLFPSGTSPAVHLALFAPLADRRAALPMDIGTLDPQAVAVLKRSRQYIPSTGSTERKNVVLIVLESVRFQPGSPFDRGFSQALHLDRVYAHHPRSVKTLEALLFGIYPSVPQVTAAWSIDQYAVSFMSPLPRLLRQQGYSTTYYAAMDPVYDNYKGTLQAAGFEQIETVTGGSRLVWGRSDAAALFSRVAETLEKGAREGKPQFVMAWTAECHMPYDYAGAKDDAKSPIERYSACQAALAQDVEQLIQRLKNGGRLDDTVVVVLGDHGEIFSEEKSGESGHGYHVYEPSLRVPVLLFLPEYTGALRDQRLFQHVDIPTTILAALKYPIPEGWVGRNMLDDDEPGRDFIVFLSMLSDGPLGVLYKAGVKYVRNGQQDSFVSYDLNQDPDERVGRSVDQQVAVTIEKHIQTYLALATQGWESRRHKGIPTSYTFPGSVIAQWIKGHCIHIVPDEERGTALVQPVATPECNESTDPGERCVLAAFPTTPFKAGGFLEIQFQIADGEDVQGKQPQALMKTSAMEKPIAINVRPSPGEWQTVLFALPKAEGADPISGEKLTDTMVAMVPVNLPVRFTVRSVKIEPLASSIRGRLWAWWVEQFG